MNDTMDNTANGTSGPSAADAFTAAELATLVDVAETSLRAALAERRRWYPDPSAYPLALRRPGAAFVTIRREGLLLGCIGTMEPVEPLVTVVADRTIAAAFHDPRTRGVHVDDWEHLHLEVSVLSPLERFTVLSYDELVVHVGGTREGLLVEAGRYRATFLPSVWDELTEPDEFVEYLWRKAGLPRRAWPSGLELYRYGATKAYGTPPRPPLPA